MGEEVVMSWVVKPGSERHTRGEFDNGFHLDRLVDVVLNYEYRRGEATWWRYAPGPLEAQIRKLEGRE